jgi:hypothetical protein
MLVQAVLERPQLRYPLHFALLALFAAVLALRPVAAAINPFGRNWPEAYFGIYGAAHAIAVLLSTRRRRSAAAAIVFVASAALLCMAVALLWAQLFQRGGPQSRWWQLAPPSAGALGYAILVRWLLVRFDAAWILAPAAGALGFAFGLSLRSPGATIVLPVAGWWLAFSLWLYCADVWRARV